MKLLPLLLLSLTLPCALQAQSASARTAVYATVDLTAYGVRANNYDYYKAGAPGFMIGGFYNFPIDSRVTVGLDLRGTGTPGTKGGGAGALALRVAFVPHHVRLRPYFGIGGGFVSTSTNTELVNDGIVSKTYTGGGAELFFGLDIRLTDSFDLRPIDYGAIAGGTTGVAFLGTGLVYHFHTR